MISSDVPAVDFHCHLDLYPDFPDILAECQEANIATLAVTTTPFAYPRNVQAAKKFPLILAALGLHPQIVGERHASIKEFERLLPEAKFVGEVGLDAGPRFYRTYDEQKKIFRRIIELCSTQGGKVLSLHSVRSAKDILDVLEEFQTARNCRVIFHWFSGSSSEMRRGIEMGCYFSVNETMLLKENDLEKIKVIPIQRILTETDGPFNLSKQGISLRPKSIFGFLEKIGNIYGKNSEDIKGQLWRNITDIKAVL